MTTIRGAWGQLALSTTAAPSVAIPTEIVKIAVHALHRLCVVRASVWRRQRHQLRSQLFLRAHLLSPYTSLSNVALLVNRSGDVYYGNDGYYWVTVSYGRTISPSRRSTDNTFFVYDDGDVSSDIWIVVDSYGTNMPYMIDDDAFFDWAIWYYS